MTKTVISRFDLEHNLGEIVSRVRRGELMVLTNSGEEEVILIDPTDFRLLQAVAGSAADSAQMAPEARVVRDYLDERITLGKAAEELGLSRFDLRDRFCRLGIPGLVAELEPLIPAGLEGSW